MSEFDTKTLDRKLRQAQALIDRAEHPNTPPGEAAESRRLAEKLMAKYRLDEEEVRKSAVAQGTEAIKPIIMDFPLCRFDSQYRPFYQTMFNEIIHHVGNIRAAYTYDNGVRNAVMVGFESDVKYAQILYASLRLHFANRLEPEIDPQLSDKENIYRLRSAGWVRKDIRVALGWSDNTAGKVQKLYEEACRDRGEEPVVAGRNVNAKLYRKSFAAQYVTTIGDRLWNMRLHAEGVSLVLAGRKEAVNEAYYTRFPEFRPISREDRQLGEGTHGGPGGNCPKCKKAKSGYCRDHNYLKPHASKQEKHSSAGLNAGHAAAASADLGGSPAGNQLPGGA